MKNDIDKSDMKLKENTIENKSTIMEDSQVKVENENASITDDSDEDSIVIVLRDLNELEDLIKQGKEIEKNIPDEQNEFYQEEQNNDASVSLGENNPKFKYSGQLGLLKNHLPLPGRAGQINENNFHQFVNELGKRNTPFEVDLDNMGNDKPWTNIGQTKYTNSLDDYFNYGFNEVTWKQYAARQVALRIHSIEKNNQNLQNAE